MPTYGQRPEDVVQDSRGNALSGVSVKFYASEALANGGGVPLETVTTDSRGRWHYTSAGGEVWVRLPDGTVWQIQGAAIGGGITDHGALTGLADDDHPQYHNDARGDARYYTQAQVTTSLAGKAASVHTHPSTDVSDSTATGRSVLTAANAAAARTAIGAGTSNLVVGTTAADAKAGNYQPTAANISDSTVTGRALITAADATAARTATGAAAASHTHVATTDLTATGTKDATTYLRGDNTWAVPAGGGGGASASPAAAATKEIAGRYYNGSDQITTANKTMPRNLVCYPISFSRAVTIDRIGVHVTTAGAGEVVRLGIYATGSDGLPTGTAILDAGTVSLAATGLAEATVSQALSANTLYWLGITHGATGTSAQGHGDASGTTQYGSGSFLGRDAPSGLPFTCIFRVGNSDAVLPDVTTGSSWSYATDYTRPYVRIA